MKPVPTIKGMPVFGNLFQFVSDKLKFTVEALAYGDVTHYKLFHQDIYQINNPTFVQQVLVENADKIQKGKLDKSVFNFLMGQGLVTNDGASHKTQRKLVQPAFHSKRIENYAQIMVDYTQRMVKDWEVSGVVDIHHEMLEVALYIVSKALYNADVYKQAEGVGKAAERINHVGGQAFSLGFMPPAWLPIPMMRQANRDLAKLDSLLMPIIEERRRTNTDEGDLLSMLLMAQGEDGSGMSDQQVRDEVVTLFLAGHETTANALAWAWYVLATRPDIEAKIHEELDGILQGRTPSMADLKHLPYLDMFMKETMRLYPPAWTLNGRTPLEDLQLGDYRVPKGSLMFIVPYAMHRNERYYAHAETFMPERWTDDFEKQLPRYAYMPFGGGPRVCIGNSFATMEFKLIMATIAQRYSLSLVPNQDIQPIASITLHPKDAIQVVVREHLFVPYTEVTTQVLDKYNL